VRQEINPGNRAGCPHLPNQNMTGDKLLIALRRTKYQVLFIRDGLDPVAISGEKAIDMALTGLYSGSGTNQRIKAIFVTPPVIPVPVWQECWRTISSAVCPPSYGYDPRTRGGIGA
jgi:hypothetical protein